MDAKKKHLTRIYTKGDLTVRMFPEEFIQLIQEVETYHPLLADVIKTKKEVEEILGEIGAYCNILLDGHYQFTELCDKLYWALRSMRPAPTIWTPPDMTQ